MKDHARTRLRASRRGTALAVAMIGMTPGLGGGVAIAASQLGPVSPKVLAVINTPGNREFIPARHARPMVQRQAAVQDAISTVPWRGCATGISLLRTTKHNHPAPRSLVWLVSLHANIRIFGTGGPRRPHSHGHGFPANWFVVAVSAQTGAYVFALDGYTPKLPRWTSTKPSPCEGT